MIVREPLQQGVTLHAQRRVSRSPVQARRCLEKLVAHFAPVTHSHAYVGQDFADFVQQQVDAMLVGFTVNHETNK